MPWGDPPPYLNKLFVDTPPPLFPTDSLSSYWKFEEASGTRADSYGSNDLSPTNNPTRASGKLDFAVHTSEGDGSYLSCPSADNIHCGGDSFTMACWIYADVLHTSGTSTDWQIFAFKDNEFFWAIGEGPSEAALRMYLMNGGGTLRCDLNVGGLIDATTWYFVVTWYDSVASKLYMEVNNSGSPSEKAASSGFVANSDPFQIGAGWGGMAYTGLVDGFGYWKKALTADERTALYNGGAGRDYEV